MIGRRALVPERTAGEAGVPVVAGDLLIPCPSTAQVVLKGVSGGGGELRLGRRRPLVVLDDTVLPGDRPLLCRIGLGLRLRLWLRRGKDRRIVQLGRLVLEL